MAEFCSACGSKVKGGDKFCSKCGSKILTETHINNTEAKASVPSKSQTKTLEQYLSFKTDQQAGFFAKKRKQDKTTASIGSSKKSRDNHVVINIERITENESRDLKPLRGSKLPLKVCKDFNAEQVMAAALEKLSNHDQYFLSNVEYVLLYPDQKVVQTVPGTEEDFTVALYKKELAKPYSKIDLFLCKTIEYTKHIANGSDCRGGPKANSTKVEESEQKQFTTVNLVDNSSDDDDGTLQKCPFDVGFDDAFDDAFVDAFNGDKSDKPLVASNTCGQKTAANALMRCPICNLQFPLLDIKEHADACATNRTTPFLCIPDGKDSENEQKGPGNDTNHADQIDMPHIIENKSKFKHELARAIRTGASMDLTQHVTINVRRGFAFRDFHNFFSKSWNKRKQNHPYTITFVGEAGLGTGGVSREFYSEALREVKSQFFTGNEDQGYEPCCGLVSVADGTIHSIGHLFVASMCNNGPNPGFLAPWVYKYFTGGVQGVLQSLPSKLSETSSYNMMYKELVAGKSDSEVSDIFKSDDALSMLEAVGYRGDPTKATLENKNSVLQSMFIKARIEPLLTALNEIMAGLTTYNMLHVIQQNRELFRAVFCSSDIFMWDHASFLEILKPQFSEEGSNKKSFEITTYKSFIDFPEACCYDESSTTTLGQLMKFITGSATLPCLGLPHDLKVEFIHECAAKCKCLPTVSTCAICLYLPVHIITESDMREAFDIAITSEIGFGRC